MAESIQFGTYQLRKRIAVGGMGELFLATDAEGQPCVIKRILHQHLGNPEYLRMFVDEASLVQRLRHPNIVRIVDLSDVDGQPFIAMEHVRGPTLRSTLDRVRAGGRQLPIRHVVEIGIQLLDALDHAHNAVDEDGRALGVVHRDINPDNVIIGYDGDAKLIDFGIAKSGVNRVQTAVGTIKGKFAYMSPEQSAADPVDARSDLFSAGIVLYEAATLSNPFARSNVVLALEAIQTKPVAPPSSLRRDAAPLDAPLGRALEKDPGHRHSTAAEFRDGLTALLSQLPSAPPLGRTIQALHRDEFIAESATLNLPPSPPSGPRLDNPPGPTPSIDESKATVIAPLPPPRGPPPKEAGRTLDRRTWMAYGALVAGILGLGALIVRDGSRSSGPLAASDALGRIRLVAQPSGWIRIGESAAVRLPLAIEVFEDDGEIQVASGPRTADFSVLLRYAVEDGALRVFTTDPVDVSSRGNTWNVAAVDSADRWSLRLEFEPRAP